MRAADARLEVGPLDERCVRFWTGREKSACLSVGIYGSPPDNGSDRIPVPNCIVEKLDVDCVDGLSAGIAIGAGIKAFR